MPSLASREKKILFLSVGFVCFALLFHFFLDPFFREWKELSTKVQVAATRLQKTQLLLRKRNAIEGAFKKYEGLSTKEGAILEGGMTGMFEEVEGLAQKSSLKILEMRPLPPKRKEFFQEQGLEVSAEGTASQFAQFLYNLLNTPKSLKVEKLELNSRAGQEQSLRGILSITTLTQ